MADIRTAIAANLGTIADVQWSPYMLANPTPPAGHVVPAGIEYDLAMHRGYDALTFTVVCFVGQVSDIGAQKRIDRMLAPSGADSVKQALESDRTLGGHCSDLHVTSVGPYQVVVLGERAVLALEWNLYVIA